jgi:hypothetical protein
MIPRDGVRGSFFESMGTFQFDSFLSQGGRFSLTHFESMGTFQIDSRGANGDGSH